MELERLSAYLRSKWQDRCINRWFSAFLMLQSFNIVPHIDDPPQPECYLCFYFITVILLLL